MCYVARDATPKKTNGIRSLDAVSLAILDRRTTLLDTA